MKSTLAEVSSYTHPAVVRRFQKEHPALSAQASDLFHDLLIFLWGSKKHDFDRGQKPDDEALQFVFIMDEEMRGIDQMWHVFLLYTQDYMEFCNQYFGDYLHHLPDIVPSLLDEKFDSETNLTKFLGYAFDELGEDVVRRWFPASSQS
jgi:hypothetical protein